MDDFAALFRIEVPHEVQSASNLERARRIVILVFHVEVETGLANQQRMPQEGRRLERAIHAAARGINVSKCK